jgi:hypothetical protein
MSYRNIVIVSVPYTDTSAPIMAPGALKAVSSELGISCRAFDLNAVVTEYLKGNIKKDEIVNFLLYSQINSEIINELNDLFEMCVSAILETSPDLVCLSLLHYQCKESTKWISFLIKKLSPSTTILIGGPGITDDVNSQTTGYADSLRKSGLIDHYIYGDGEHAFKEFLSGNLHFPGINGTGWKAIDNLNLLPYSDYDDYDFSLYSHPFLNIVGSRGCVRKCTFCDVHETWERFYWRSADNIFQEMLFQATKYNIRTFKFQDNLINGNVKEFNRLIEMLAEYNNHNPDKKLSWASYFIFRPKSQMSETMWKLTAESGAVQLQVGVESLVDKNRHHMKKKFNNDDLIYGLDMAKKYKIKILMILLVGYVTETEEDHIETMAWLKKYANYASDPITKITVGGTLAILPNTWLSRNQEQLGITWKNGKDDIVKGKNHLWEIKQTNNNYSTRVRRWGELIDVGTSSGYDIVYSIIDPQKELENSLVSYVKRTDCRY